MIDWTRIKNLRSEIGEDDFFEVVAMFFEETDVVMAQLIGPSELSVVESRLHFLKGSALNLGLADLAEICEVGEKLAASGDAGSVDLQKVAAIYNASKITLLSMLGQPEAA